MAAMQRSSANGTPDPNKGPTDSSAPQMNNSAFSIMSLELPARFPLPTSDARFYCTTINECKLMLDPGGQVTIMGEEALQMIREHSDCFKTYKLHPVPITGISENGFKATIGCAASIPVQTVCGNTVQFAIHGLVCPGFKGLIAGLPDLVFNGVVMDMNSTPPKATMRDSIISVSMATEVASHSGSACIGGLRVLAIENKLKDEPHGGSPISETTLSDPNELVEFSDHPTSAFQLERNDAKFSDLPPELSPFGDITGDPAQKFSSNSLLLQKVLDFQSEVHRGDTNLTIAQGYQIVFLLSRFQDLFVKTLPVAGALKAPEHCIMKQLKHMKPIRQAPYKIKDPVRTYMKRALEKDVENGLKFKPEAHDVVNTIPAFPVFQQEKMRIVGAFMQLNQALILDAWPCPTTADTLGRMMNASFRAAFDFKSGFMQNRKSTPTVHRSILITMDGLYGSRGNDFGMKNSPQHFCRSINHIYKRNENLHIHIDDANVFTASYPSFFKSMASFLLKTEEHHGYLKIAKLQIAPKRFKAVGHLFIGKTRRPDDSRLAALKEIAPAKTKSHVRSILGMFVFWDEYILGLQKINKPIRDLLVDEEKTPPAQRRTKGPVRWTPEADSALQKLKKMVLTRAVLAIPDYSQIDAEHPLDLYTDASAIAQGFILVQTTLDGKRHLLQCGSRAIPRTKRHRHINYLEIDAIPWAHDKCDRITALQPVRNNFDSRNIHWFVKNAKVKLSADWSRLSMSVQHRSIVAWRFVKGINNEMSNIFTRFTNEHVEIGRAHV